jgi:hypothetical protein
VQVTFSRSRERRYRVTIDRARAKQVVIEPAPGYNPYLPHDLLHFLVEAECAIQYGIFGRFAAGAGRSNDQCWKRLRALGADDIARSERLAGLALRAWERDETPSELERLMPRLAKVARRWHSLPVGGSLTLDWPFPEARAKAAFRRRERPRPAPRR